MFGTSRRVACLQAVWHSSCWGTVFVHTWHAATLLATARCCLQLQCSGQHAQEQLHLSCCTAAGVANHSSVCCSRVKQRMKASAVMCLALSCCTAIECGAGRGRRQTCGCFKSVMVILTHRCTALLAHRSALCGALAWLCAAAAHVCSAVVVDCWQLQSMPVDGSASHALQHLLHAMHAFAGWAHSTFVCNSKQRRLTGCHVLRCCCSRQLPCILFLKSKRHSRCWLPVVFRAHA